MEMSIERDLKLISLLTYCNGKDHFAMPGSSLNHTDKTITAECDCRAIQI